MAKKRGNAFGAIKGIFWQPADDEEDDLDVVDEDSEETAEEAPVAETATATTSTPAPAPTAAASIPPPAAPVAGAEDEAIKDSLSQALANANLDGYDYFEFAQAVEAQKKFIPAEQTQYQSAFAMAASMGVTADSLIANIGHYMDVLKGEAGKFQEMVDGQIAENVTSKEEELAGIDATIAEKAEQIQALTDEINQLSASKTELSGAITDSRAQIEKVQGNFGATLKVFIDRLTSDEEKIRKYLGGTSATTEPAKEAADA